MKVDWNEMAGSYPLDRDRPSIRKTEEILGSRLGSFGSVADIGCGPGNQSIVFAGMFGRVYSVDSSPNMLGRLRSECESRGITNVTTLESDCMEASLPERCDLAFSSLCPGMYSMDGMRKLEELGDACMFMAGTYGKDCTERRILEELGIDYRKWFDTMDLYEGLSETRDVSLEVVSDPMRITGPDRAVRRCMGMTDGSRETEDILKRYFERNDPTDTDFRRDIAILFWESDKSA